MECRFELNFLSNLAKDGGGGGVILVFSPPPWLCHWFFAIFFLNVILYLLNFNLLFPSAIRQWLNPFLLITVFWLVAWTSTPGNREFQKLLHFIVIFLQVPFIIPVVALIIAIYLVVAPLVDSPDIIILYAAIFMLCGPLVYFVFVYKKLKIPGLDLLTMFLQKLFNVAPTEWKSD